MANELAGPPVLSTPAELLFEHIETVEALREKDSGQVEHETSEALREVYEIARTARELRDGRRRRIALQFPDHMLRDAPAVVGLLREELDRIQSGPLGRTQAVAPPQAALEAVKPTEKAPEGRSGESPRIYILADTSYSACCVDEIAAEHVDADVVVHYGRSCLSPTSRLPVIYVFTKHSLDYAAVIEDFEKEFPDKDRKAVLMADVTYQDHLPALYADLVGRGYTGALSTAVIHHPSGKLPNRTLVSVDGETVDCEGASPPATDLSQYDVFHISSPPTSLLLALSSRVRSLRIFPTTARDASPDHASSVTETTRRLLGRRYARLLTLSTAGIIGILVNTLSVSNYLPSIDAIRRQIAAAGKKSYTVVVGKLNPAKLANFAEIDGWVVVGCWESSLVEDDAAFYRPAITPFELEVALMKDEERVWGDRWWGGIEGVREPEQQPQPPNPSPGGSGPGQDGERPSSRGANALGDDTDEEESEPPEFDLRTGRLVSRSRPMRAAARGAAAPTSIPPSTDDGRPRSGEDTVALALRPKAEVATINGVVSPGAEYLRSQRTWVGLGSDFADGEEERSTVVEEGRRGVASGYTVGELSGRT